MRFILIFADRPKFSLLILIKKLKLLIRIEIEIK